jgi:hypothetical protein
MIEVSLSVSLSGTCVGPWFSYEDLALGLLECVGTGEVRQEAVVVPAHFINKGIVTRDDIPPYLT